MTSQENFGPQFDGLLFHGTPEEFKPGDVVLPASMTNKEPSADATVAYATPSLHTAKFMAWEQNNWNGENWREDRDVNPPVENVYRVEPVDPEEKLGGRGNVLVDPTQTTGKTGQYGDVTHGYSREVTSKKGFRVLSKVFDPARTINLKKRLARMDIERGNLLEREKWKNEAELSPTDPDFHKKLDERMVTAKKVLDKTPMSD